MCEDDIQWLENMIRSAMANIIIDEQTEAICNLAECLKKINEYL